MTLIRRLGLLCISMSIWSCLKAQIEIVHLTSKGYTTTGFGAFFNVSVPASTRGSLTAEAGFYSFNHNRYHIALVPFLLGYRYTFDGSGSGVYVEPAVGYSIGATDIQKMDQYGLPISDGNGNRLEQKVKGMTAGLGAGYISPGQFSFNIGLRYQQVFVSDDPILNMFSLRLSHPFSLRKRVD